MDAIDWAQKLKNLFSGSSTPETKKPKKSDVENEIRNSPLFKNVPNDKIAPMIEKGEVIKKDGQDVVLREGEEGDFYYFILDGKASVVRRPSRGADPVIVARLTKGEAFGEEALISNAKRNATVIMNTEGFLLRMPKDAFSDYMRDSLVTWQNAVQCQHRINKGAKWLDVRDISDYRKGHLPGALSLPLIEIRERSAELDPKVEYVCCCDNGRLSATGAFLLRQRGFATCVLQGGMRRLAGPTTQDNDPWRVTK
ncbi:MAG: cyclic nucleotide-binding domain-containing protein [bacterium]